MSEEELQDAFQVHGKIQDIHMVRDRRNQESKGCKHIVMLFLEFHQIYLGIAYIKYEKASAAARAMEEMNGTVIAPHVRPLKVGFTVSSFLNGNFIEMSI
jgi:RNA recognition motif-containing protein